MKETKQAAVRKHFRIDLRERAFGQLPVHLRFSVICFWQTDFWNPGGRKAIKALRRMTAAGLSCVRFHRQPKTAML